MSHGVKQVRVKASTHTDYDACSAQLLLKHICKINTNMSTIHIHNGDINMMSTHIATNNHTSYRHNINNTTKVNLVKSLILLLILYQYDIETCSTLLILYQYDIETCSSIFTNTTSILTDPYITLML